MLNVILAIQGRDIRATERAATLMTKETQPTEVVLFAKRELTAAIFGVDGEELGRDNFTAILHRRVRAVIQKKAKFHPSAKTLHLPRI